MIKTIAITLCFIFAPNLSFSDELGRGQRSNGSRDTYSDSQNSPSTFDFSSVPPRDNVGQCTQDELDQRQERQNECIQNFSSYGITETIKPHEVIEAQSCDKIEEWTEILAGCQQFFSEHYDNTIDGISSIFINSQDDEEILEKCNEKPTAPIGASRRAARRGQNSISAQERASLESFARAMEKYNNCATPIKIAGEKRRERERQAHKAQMDRYRSSCRATVNQRLRASVVDRLIKSCMLSKAGRDGCESCINELTHVPIGLKMIKSVYDEMRKYRGFFCYNKKTQGKMVCAAAAAASPFFPKAISLAAKLPRAFRSATNVAKRAIAKTQAQAKLAVGIRDISTLPAVRNGRVTVAELRRNANLSDTDRITEAQKLLGGRDLTPNQRKAIIEAHEVGSDRQGAGIGNYSQSELYEKRALLENKGFSENEIQTLMDKGIAGKISEIRSPLYDEISSLRPPSTATELVSQASLRKQLMDSPEFATLRDPETFAQQTQQLYERTWRKLRTNGDYEGALNALHDLREIYPDSKYNEITQKIRKMEMRIRAERSGTPPTTTAQQPTSPATRRTPRDDLAQIRNAHVSNPQNREQTLAAMNNEVDRLEKQYRASNPNTVNRRLAEDYQELQAQRNRLDRSNPQQAAEADAIDLELQAFENHGAKNGTDFFVSQRAKRGMAADERVARERVADRARNPASRNNWSPQQRSAAIAEEDSIISLLRPTRSDNARIDNIRRARQELRTLRSQPANNGERNRAIINKEREIVNTLRQLPPRLQEVVR